MLFYFLRVIIIFVSFKKIITFVVRTLLFHTTRMGQKLQEVLYKLRRKKIVILCL